MNISDYIAKYLIPVLERKKIVIICTLIGVILSLPFSFIIKPEYITVATIFVEEPYYQSRKIWENTLAPKQPAQGYVEMEARRIQGASFVAEVVKVLPQDIKEKLKEPYTTREQIEDFVNRLLVKIFGKNNRLVQFVKQKTKKKTEYDLIINIMNRVEVRCERQSGLIYITAKTLEPETGPAILKAYLDIWISQNVEENKESARAQTRFAKKLRDKAYLEFIKAQKQLTDFRKKYEIPGGVEITRDVDIMLKLNSLKAKVEAARDRLKQVDDLYTNAKMAEAGITSNLRIVQYPDFPIKVTRVKSIKLITATIMVFFGIGVGIALGLEFLEGKIRTQVDIEDTVDIPVIGQIGRME